MHTTHWPSRRDGTFIGLMAAVQLVLLAALVPLFQVPQKGAVWYVAVVVIIAVLALLLWAFWGTHYTITASHLYYRSGPYRGSIALAEIRSVEVDTTRWVGLKPATAKNGVLVKYDRYKEIYLSPLDNERFVQALLAGNPSITR